MHTTTNNNPHVQALVATANNLETWLDTPAMLLEVSREVWLEEMEGAAEWGASLIEDMDMVVQALYELGLHAEPDQGDRFDRDSVIWVAWED